jgi:hypothetical protein
MRTERERIEAELRMTEEEKTIAKIRQGRSVPERAKALLAERVAAEQSALDQLAAIVRAQSGK